MYPDLIAAAAEFRHDVRGKHAGIAARHVYVEIRQQPQLVQRVVKRDAFSSRIVRIRDFVGHLYLVDEEIKTPFPAFRAFADERRKPKWVTIHDVPRQVE